MQLNSPSARAARAALHAVRGRGAAEAHQVMPDAVVRVLGVLWPQSVVAVATRAPASTGRDRASDDDVVEFVAVPSLSNPRLLLPTRSLAASAAALRRYNTALTGPAKTKVDLLAVAVRLGAGRVWPQRVRVSRAASCEADSIDAFLARAVGRPVRVAIYLGPVRAVQKPVLQLLDRDATTIGYAKVGVDELTRALVRHEAEALRFLTETQLDALAVPEPIHAGEWQDCPVLVTRALPAGGPPDPHAVAAAAVEIAGVRGVERDALAGSEYLAGLRKRIAALPEDDLSGLLGRSLDAAVRSCGARVLAFGSWHGDWAPWNMTSGPMRSDGSRVPVVWDWEQFETGVPLGFDAVHHALQVAAVVDGLAPNDAVARVDREADAVLGPFGVTGADVSLVMTLYLLEIATRYLHDGELREGGTSLGRLDHWLPAAIAGRPELQGATA